MHPRNLCVRPPGPQGGSGALGSSGRGLYLLKDRPRSTVRALSPRPSRPRQHRTPNPSELIHTALHADSRPLAQCHHVARSECNALRAESTRPSCASVSTSVLQICYCMSRCRPPSALSAPSVAFLSARRTRSLVRATSAARSLHPVSFRALRSRRLALARTAGTCVRTLSLVLVYVPRFPCRCSFAALGSSLVVLSFLPPVLPSSRTSRSFFVPAHT